MDSLFSNSWYPNECYHSESGLTLEQQHIRSGSTLLKNTKITIGGLCSYPTTSSDDDDDDDGVVGGGGGGFDDEIIMLRQKTDELVSLLKFKKKKLTYCICIYHDQPK